MYTRKWQIGMAVALTLSLAGCSAEQSGATLDPEPEASDVATTDTTEPKATTDPEPTETEPEPERGSTSDDPAIGAVGDTIEVSQGDESIGAVTVASVETSNRPYDKYGEAKSGLLAFDVPTEHDRLAYAPNYDGGPICVWEF